MNHYTQLTQDQRYQIYAMNKACFSQMDIALEIGVHRSMISRELRPNAGLRGYRPQQTHTLASYQCDKAAPRIVSDHWQEIERLILDYWSPEQTTGKIKIRRSQTILKSFQGKLRTFVAKVSFLTSDVPIN